jgi:hypothetical protein
MPALLNRFPNMKKVLIFFIVLIFYLVCFTFSVDAQTTWLVTVDVTSGSPKPTYRITHTGTGNTCDSSQDNSGTNGDIYVCLGDKVLWTAKSKMDSNGKMHHHLILGQEDDVLDRTSTSGPTHIFHDHEGVNLGGAVDDLADLKDHKYSVFVFDSVAGSPFIDDPKIIIGGTRSETEFATVEKTLATLRSEIDNEKKLAAKLQKQLEELKKRTK